jgi:hypothetical protein
LPACVLVVAVVAVVLKDPLVMLLLALTTLPLLYVYDVPVLLLLLLVNAYPPVLLFSPLTMLDSFMLLPLAM